MIRESIQDFFDEKKYQQKVLNLFYVVDPFPFNLESGIPTYPNFCLGFFSTNKKYRDHFQKDCNSFIHSLFQISFPEYLNKKRFSNELKKIAKLRIHDFKRNFKEIINSYLKILVLSSKEYKKEILQNRFEKKENGIMKYFFSIGIENYSKDYVMNRMNKIINENNGNGDVFTLIN